MFVPGQLVVCVGLPVFAWTEDGTKDASKFLAVGTVYTVAEFYPAGFPIWSDATLAYAAVALGEFPDDAYHHTFDARLFRPLSLRSIRVVESLKATVPGKVTEPA